MFDRGPLRDTIECQPMLVGPQHQESSVRGWGFLRCLVKDTTMQVMCESGRRTAHITPTTQSQSVVSLSGTGACYHPCRSPRHCPWMSRMQTREGLGFLGLSLSQCPCAVSPRPVEELELLQHGFLYAIPLVFFRVGASALPLESDAEFAHKNPGSGGVWGFEEMQALVVDNFQFGREN
ncbi:hypothetical protein NDU88_004363 [Pleurodeles waltl]|uniref:Uncharacterized protein n=1 Tax=Pleurodeles waltl TaxID=8319 RepID=A0AAV7NKV2_PLEWA|nr:hypothetical protein NDU88_004363 [Pleurodeles waltl]